jgi:hypothetical protein
MGHARANYLHINIFKFNARNMGNNIIISTQRKYQGNYVIINGRQEKDIL